MWRHTFEITTKPLWNRLTIYLIFRLISPMMKYLILVLVYIALVNGSVKDDLKDKATEALNQGEKVKVCFNDKI